MKSNSAADEFDGSDTTCCFTDNIGSSELSKPPLSEEGKATAIAYGLKVLEENKRPS